MHRSLFGILLAAISSVTCSLVAKEPSPLFRDFVGLCGHTVAFKPELYAPVCSWVRDYHPVPWDLKDDTSMLPEWPFARNRVSWEKVYGSWHGAGLHTSVCLTIDEMKGKWKDPARDAEAYAGEFAKLFGPGGKWPFIESVEIGNEPGLYPDEDYLKIFDAMSKGIRAANSKVKIVTCNVEAGKSERYWKSASIFADRAASYDVLQIHRYAIAEQWPVWRRTYPENPAVPFLSSVRSLLSWRDQNAPGKEVWVTEFGWDASSKKPDPKGEWAKWVGSTDEEQARYMVRSFLLFAGMGVDKAFAYFFNDKDEPKLHAASGLTRNYQPKPAYHAVAWMLKSLAGHRFHRALKESLEDGYVYEFVPEKDGDPIVWAAWHATKDDFEMTWPEGGKKLLKTEIMPLAAGPTGTASATLPRTIGQRPTLIWWSGSEK